MASSLQKAAETAVERAAPTPEQTIAQIMDKQRAQIALALPNSMDPARFARITITECKANPALLRCEPLSLLAAVMRAAQLGLEPGPLGHCYLVPFKNGATGRTDVQFILGYKGIVSLARRSGEIEDVYAEVVYGGDHFDYELGLHRNLTHKRAATDRTDANISHAYAVAHFKGGGYAFVVLDRIEIDARRARSRASSKGPWVTDYAAMARKSAVRALAPWLPLTIELVAAERLDGAPVPAELASVDLSEWAALPAAGVDAETGEIIDTAETTPEPAAS